MAKIPCSIEMVEMENDDGIMVPGIIATCSKCDHVTESFGQTERSIKRCLVLMREECELGEGDQNFYVDDSE